MRRKRKRSAEERKLRQAREADRDLRRERAHYWEARAAQTRLIRSTIGKAAFRVTLFAVPMICIPPGYLWLLALAVSLVLLVLYLLLHLYVRRLERERDFYGYALAPGASLQTGNKR